MIDVHLQFFGDSNIYMFGLGKTYRSFRNGSKLSLLKMDG